MPQITKKSLGQDTRILATSDAGTTRLAWRVWDDELIEYCVEHLEKYRGCYAWVHAPAEKWNKFAYLPSDLPANQVPPVPATEDDLPCWLK